jgi:hypothetical protein
VGLAVVAGWSGVWGYVVASQDDHAGFARAVLEVVSKHGNMASEACWQELSEVVTQHWLVFQHEQSPLSTWGMLAKCTETILKIKAFNRVSKDGGGQDALEEFREFMKDVTGEK